MKRNPHTFLFLSQIDVAHPRGRHSRVLTPPPPRCGHFKRDGRSDTSRAPTTAVVSPSTSHDSETRSPPIEVADDADDPTDSRARPTRPSHASSARTFARVASTAFSSAPERARGVSRAVGDAHRAPKAARANPLGQGMKRGRDDAHAGGAVAKRCARR